MATLVLRTVQKTRDEQHLQDIRDHVKSIQYLKASCYRKVRLYDDAQLQYLQFSQEYNIIEKDDLVITLFGMVTCVLSKDRRQIMNILENLLYNINLYGDKNNKVENSLTKTFYLK